jgi:Tol biopolymer transport system component
MLKTNRRRRWFLRWLACAFAFITVACGGPSFLEPEDMAPSWDPDSTHIAFVCTRRQMTKTWDPSYPYLGPYSGKDGYTLLEICVSDLDGNNRHQLTDNLVPDLSPGWSPDGTQIVFVSSRDSSEGMDIYVMQSDGAKPVNLTRHPAGYSQPRWSPNGQTIAFTSTRDNLNSDLYVMGADGSHVTRLTRMGWIGNFDWSSDSKSIVFEGGVTADKGIYTVNIENDSIIQLTHNQTLDSEPVWSPDGKYVAFRSEREDGFQIYTMDVRLHEETKISRGPDPSEGVTWSPDGRFLSYVGGVDPNQKLYLLNLETRALTTFPDFETLNTPKWSPNSQYLVYERTEDWNKDGFGESKLWVLRVTDGMKWAVSSLK